MVKRRNLKIYTFFVASVCVVASIAFFVTNAKGSHDYTPRLEQPGYDNQYYYSDLNEFYTSGYGMPNCTAYAYGRSYENLEAEPMLCRGNASDWFYYNIENEIYAYGSQPKVGAVACWEGGDGHVAVVEQVIGTTVTFSESAWNGSEFYTSESSVNSEHMGYPHLNFLGYIYVGEPFDAYATEVVDEIWKINIDVGVYLRKTNNIGSQIIGEIEQNEYIRVVEKVNIAGYTWGKTSHKGVTGWCVIDYADKISDTGDVNLDGIINVTDVLELKKYLNGSLELSGEQLAAAGATDSKANTELVSAIEERIANK